MDITEALKFIHGTLKFGYNLGLERVTELLSRLGNPERRCKAIHVAGTNGKGSTCAMLASILSAAGYKTGLYTSPYLYRFNERIQIDGVKISDDELSRVTETVRAHALAMDDHPTEFELVSAIAFEYFARQNCDFVVLEVGLGGRLDATNAIDDPLCCAITAIGYDHMEYLGDTLEQIAYEKAGIIKAGCDVVLYEQDEPVTGVVANVCRERGANLRIADFSQIESLSDSLEGQEFKYRGIGYRIPLLGAHQLKNAAVVLEVIDVIRGKGVTIDEEAVRRGLSRTVWPARFEILQRDPYFIVDGGHNPQCAESVAANIREYFPDKRAVLLIGVLGDKDYAGLTSILDPVAESYVAVSPDNPRALPASELAEHLKGYGKPVIACETIEDGVSAALKAASTSGLACAVGSLYMAGNIRAYFGLI